MKLHVASLITLCLLLAVPAFADYSNGSINGTTDAWTINFGHVVSDNFTGTSTVVGFMFGVWEFPGDNMTSIDWTIASAPMGATVLGRTVYGHGTATVADQFISTNQYGYNIDRITVSGLGVSLPGGKTYWLELQNAILPSGDPVYWDENSGPSKAFGSQIGTIPSEAFTVNSYCMGCSDPIGAPEPGSLTLFGSGILGLLGVLRCKLRF